MRQLQVHVPPERAGRVLELADAHGAFAPVSLSATGRNAEAACVLILNLPNDRVGAFVNAVAAEVRAAEFVLFPQGTLPFGTPLQQVHAEVRDVARRSTLELVLGALQSVGSWRGLLAYALFSGVIGAYGLVLNASYMLVAAMLVAPVGAPVMVAVVGAAIGDRHLLRRGAVRFVAALAVLVGAGAALGLAYGLGGPTEMMEQVAALSMAGAVVALAAGAAGAHSLAQSERTSLVSATAAGFLVAAALSPTAALLGLALPLGRWDYAGVAAFQLVLQFLALVLGGWGALAFSGVRPEAASTGRGSGRTRWLAAAALGVALAGMVAAQGALAPRFTRADLARRAEQAAQETVRELAGAGFVEAAARFTRADLARHPGETLLLVVRVEAEPGDDPDAVAARVREAVRARVGAMHPALVPLVDVVVLPPGGTVGPGG